jgi:hypothetical protein
MVDFLADDKAWLRHRSKIELGNVISVGTVGAVLSIKGNSNLVVKVPKGAAIKWYDDPASRRRDIYKTETDLHNEAYNYDHYNYVRKPLVSPMKELSVYSDVVERNVIALVRPKVKPVFDHTQNIPSNQVRRLTASKIEALRRDMIYLTKQGFLLTDGLQVGFDKEGRLLLYDQGCIKKYSYQASSLIRRNNNTWFYFLHTVFNYPGFTHEHVDELADTYGRIEINSKISK